MKAQINTVRNMILDPMLRDKMELRLFGRLLSDKAYLQKTYRLRTGHKLDLKQPKTYTEKIQWIKLYDRRPIYTLMQDKYAVREYIANTIGSEYLIPLIGVWKDANDIDFESLPNQFVLKCNHDCASVVICRDKRTLDIEQARKKLNMCLQKNYYDPGREWAYKDIKPLIIAEKYMSNGNEKTLTDYKFFCFYGKAKMLYVGTGEPHTDQQRIDFFDIDFNHLPIQRGSIPNADKTINKPKGFDALIPLVEKLAQNIPFIRVDFYLIEGRPYFGEVAFYPSSGFAEFSPHEWEERVGEWIILPPVKEH